MRDTAGPRRGSALWLTMTALLTAMNIVLSLQPFSIPIPLFQGHFYFCDVIIYVAALLLDPFAAFVVGGVGAFLGDLISYPAAMLVSLAAHGLQGAAASCLARRKWGKNEIGPAILGVCAGGVLMVIGYTLGRAYVYATPAYAIGKLPFEILQAALGGTLAIILCYPLRLKETFHRLTHGAL